MAETSGFFQAMLGEDGNPDRRYLAKQFCDYFALFVKNGVFGSPTNQLLVSPGSTGLSVVVKAGNAFIDGMWYNNSSDKVISIVPNYESQTRVDTVRVRMSQISRSITTDVFTGDSELQRGEDIYDLQLAVVNVQPFAETLTAANIQDTRPNETVCGFVTQLLNVQTTADLFAQYQAIFDEWFVGVKDTLGEDAAVNLLIKIEDLEEKVDSSILQTDQLFQNLGIEAKAVRIDVESSLVPIQKAFVWDWIPSLTANGLKPMDIWFMALQWFGSTNTYSSNVMFFPKDSSTGFNLSARDPIPKDEIYQKNNDGTYVRQTSAKIENPLYQRSLQLKFAENVVFGLEVKDCFIFEEDSSSTIWYAGTKIYPRGCAVNKVWLYAFPKIKK